MIHPERRRENLKKIEEMDREKVIKDLEFCVNGHFKVELSLAKKILAMLKEQETTNICHKKNARIFSCEKCGYGLDDIYLTNEKDYPVEPAYCPNCGRKVVDDA